MPQSTLHNLIDFDVLLPTGSSVSIERKLASVQTSSITFLAVVKYNSELSASTKLMVT